MADQENKQQYPYNPQPLNNGNQPALTDMASIPIEDGGTPQDANGIISGQYDALDPVKKADIKFDQGNYSTILGLPKIVADKIAELTQTLVPLIEVAMIELLTDESMYNRVLGKCVPAFDENGNISIQFTFQYEVDKWIGTDIEMELIQHDATYVLDKIKPVKANITSCTIDVSNGTLLIQGSI